MNNGFGLGRFILLLIFLLIIGAIALAIVRYLAQSHHRPVHADHHRGPVPSPPGPASLAAPSSVDSALEVLRMRYARGEIDEDDFNRRVLVIQGNH